MNTRSNEMVSAQIGIMGTIQDLDKKDFQLDATAFNIKNDGIQPVFLDVQLAGMKEGEFVNTRFETGWNPEIVMKVKRTSQSVNLKFGY